MPSSDTAEFTIHTVNSSDEPGNKIVDLNGHAYSTGERIFTPASTTVLDTSTKYFVFKMSGGDGVNLQSTDSDNQDSRAATGWSIGDKARSRNASGTWSDVTYSIEIAIKGSNNTGGRKPRASTGSIPSCY